MANYPFATYRPGQAILASLINYLQDGLAQNSFNVKAPLFNAKGDGSTDDTQAFQDAFDAAWSVGGRVLVPYGEYVLSNLDLPVDDTGHRTITIEGVQSNSNAYGVYAANTKYGSRLKFTEQDGSHFLTGNFDGSSAGANPHYTLRNLSLIGPDDNGGTSTAGHALYFKENDGTHAAPLVHLENIEISGFRKAGSCGVMLNWCMNSLFENVQVLACDIGYYMGNASNANTFVNCRAQYCTTVGMYAQDIETLAWLGGMFQSNDRVGVWLNGGCTAHTYIGVHFENNNSLHNSGTYALQITGADRLLGSNQKIKFINSVFNGAYDKIYVAGYDGSRQTVYIDFEGGYSQATANLAGTGTYKLLFGNANTAYCRVVEFCPPSELADTGLFNSVRWNSVEYGSRIETIATADLPAAGSNNDGRIVIENGGAGDGNLIAYMNGQRFRFDGGTAF